MRFDKKYLIIALILVVIVFVISLILYPEWKTSWWLLIIFAVIGVVGFVANFRQAFENNPEEMDTNMKNKTSSQDSNTEKIKIEETSAGGDILTSAGGNVTKIGTQVNQTVHINQSSTFLPGSTPPKPAMIIGRDDDITELKQRLSIDENKASFQILTAIKGWPGVGKTTIASALAHDKEIASQFPDGVLWTSLGQSPNILSEMATWGRALGTEEVLKAKSVDEAQALLANLLREKRMLLIIDDVWKAEDAVPFKVGGTNCATLVTTRLDAIATSLAPTANSIYRLKVLKDEDSIELLRQLAPNVVAKHFDECLVLVHELEGLPLALQVAGRLLNTDDSYGFNVAQLIEDLRDGAKLLAAPAPSDRADLVNQTTPTIAALLQKSIDILDDVTKEYYAYLGVFAPKPATFDMGAMKFVWQVEDPTQIIKTLVDRGLLEFVADLGRYQMHALLVMLAKSLLTDG